MVFLTLKLQLLLKMEVLCAPRLDYDVMGRDKNKVKLPVLSLRKNSRIYIFGFLYTDA